MRVKLFDDLVTYLIIGIIVGGRLGYILFYNLEYYSQNFIEIFFIWEGGMSFHGGLAGISLSIYIFTKIKNIEFFHILHCGVEDQIYYV